ncbi:MULTISPECIES: HD-GYP domain-containing protein [unclassified Pseudoalteromonas]|uniref:HD-GYP domain-containing protein n=1 Tax=unclassified Pseudoalteromonas TaxID=194690 RepID=UPI0004243BA7|nr:MULTISPECIES: HD-GYP domain-containing protein [unclassified Pseudoalteromonas]MBH0059828.1 HD-GYP domain-containing protein [Pseudoalteromonas sp. NZS71]PKH90199.1 HD-GYP domain-containing protein [Pseudoalteromonas sp. 78C3]
MKIIPVGQLLPGMFVQSVTRQTGSIKIKNQGWVKTQAGINNLIKAGILEVEIDPDKTLIDSVPEKAPITVPATKIKRDPWQKTHSAEQEMGKAKKLYDEAKTLQIKAFKDIKAGRDIDITPFRELASGFMDSVFRNQDALACLTQMRQKDAYLLEHSINVSILMGIFAKHLGIEKNIIVELTTGALLHDIGKIKIPDEILNKPGRFTDDEFKIMKMHSLFSKEILEESGLTGIAVDIAGMHHERLDGKGYPFAKKGDEISQYVRMASIVDVYDALTAERVYKAGMEPIKAFKILKDGCPDSFDPELLNKFIQCIGIHPVGTLVRLSSQKVGLVTESNPSTPLKPIVKTFYSAKHSRYTEIKDIDLANKKTLDTLESAVKPKEYNIDLERFYKNSILS